MASECQSPLAITDIRYNRSNIQGFIAITPTSTPDRVPMRLFESGRQSRCGGDPYPFSPGGTFQDTLLRSPSTDTSGDETSASSQVSSTRSQQEPVFTFADPTRNLHGPFDRLLASASKRANRNQLALNEEYDVEDSEESTDALLRQSAAYGLRLADELHALKSQVEELQLTNRTLETRLCQTRDRLQQERRQSMHHLQHADKELQQLREEGEWATLTLHRTLRDITQESDDLALRGIDSNACSPEHRASRKARRPRSFSQGTTEAVRSVCQEADQTADEVAGETHLVQVEELKRRLRETQEQLKDTEEALGSARADLDQEQRTSSHLRQHVLGLEESVEELRMLLKEKQGSSFAKFGTPTHSPIPVDAFQVSGQAYRYNNSPISSPLVPRRVISNVESPSAHEQSPHETQASALHDELEKGVLLEQLEQSTYQLKCARESNDLLRETVRLMKERHMMNQEDHFSRSAFSQCAEENPCFDLSNDDEPLLPQEHRFNDETAARQPDTCFSPCGGSQTSEEGSVGFNCGFKSPMGAGFPDDEMFQSPRHIPEINQPNWTSNAQEHQPDTVSSTFSTESSLGYECQTIQKHLARIHANLVGNREKRRHIAFKPAAKHSSEISTRDIKALAESLEDFMCCLVSLLTNMNECCTGHTESALLVFTEEEEVEDTPLSPRSNMARVLRRASDVPKLKVLTPAQREEIAEDCPVSRWITVASDFPTNFESGSLKHLVQELNVRSSRWKVARTRHMRARKTVREILGHHENQMRESMEVVDRFEEIAAKVIHAKESLSRNEIVTRILSSGNIEAAQVADDLVDALLEASNRPIQEEVL